MRTKKSFYNLLTTMLPQIILVFLAIFRTKYFLTSLGNEVYGIYQLFAQILAFLSLADFGLTDAVNYFLYKPISEKNYKLISSILKGAQKYFYKIMGLMLAIGLIISPFVKYFITDYTVSNLFIIIAFILFLLVYVLSYLSTPFTIMFDANQEKYKYSIYTQTIIIFRYILEIFLVLSTKNLFVIIIFEIICTLLQNLIIRLLFKKNFKKINLNVEPNYSFKAKLKSVVPHRISALISSNTDILLISKILGITVVPIYACNYYITNMLNQIVTKFSVATLASIGNVVATKGEKSYKLFLEYNAFLFIIATLLCVPLLLVFRPFIFLWYGSEYTVNFLTTIVLVSLLFYNVIRIVLNNFSSSAGLFKETLICTIPEAILNILISLLLINKYKILGVLLGTLISLFVSEYFIKPFILNKYIFKDNIFKYYRDCFIYLLFVILNVVICLFISSSLSFQNLGLWFMNGVILFTINFILVMGEYSLIKKNYFIKRLLLLKKQLIRKESDN